MKSYISQTAGTYRFPELSLNVDYEVYAQKDGAKSKTQRPSANSTIAKNRPQPADRPEQNVRIIFSRIFR